MIGTGFDRVFLEHDCPPPAPGGERSIRNLAYTHFSVLLDTARRLAAVTAVNIDGRVLRDVPRGDDWHLDERVPASEQAGPEVYARNDLDRGHLVRRRDPVWGTDAVAARANTDTFAYTNAAPQAAGFNQSKELWNGLEDHVLAYASSFALRLSVFTGPVFGDDDALYRGVRIPTRFWKVAAWSDARRGRLAAAGFLLDQSGQLDEIDLTEAAAGVTEADSVGSDASGEGPSAGLRAAAPPLGPFRTFQVPVADIGRLAGLTMPALERADVYLAPLAAAGRRWVALERFGQIRL